MDELKEYLQSKGIETAIHYPKVLPNLEVYQYLKTNSQNFSVSSEIESKILSLPLYPELEEAMIEYVANCIRNFYN